MPKLCFCMEERVVEAIRDGEVVRVSESQARQEDLFIIRRAEVIEAVTNAEIAKSMPQEGSSHRVLDLTRKEGRVNVSLLDKWKREGTDYKKNNVVKELIDNFHWDIVKIRKSRNLSRKQLADAIGFKEEDIKMVENGRLPEDNFFLVNKLEGFLKINLRKNKPANSEVSLADLQRVKEVKSIAEDRPTHENSKSKNPDSMKNLLGEDIEILE